MPTMKERVEQQVNRTPGRTDRELTTILLGDGVGQQQVNQTANALAEEGRIVRRLRPEDNKIGNYPPENGKSCSDGNGKPSKRCTMVRSKSRFNVDAARTHLNPKQTKKLELAAKMLKATAEFWDGDRSMLPHWAAGIITHGQPKGRYFEIGTTEAAKNAPKKEKTHDHLFRVTATAEYILSRAASLTVQEIENILLQRSLTMITTRSQNNNDLRQALKRCLNKDDWQELYRTANIEYTLRD
jgi:hypothetical protein